MPGAIGGGEGVPEPRIDPGLWSFLAQPNRLPAPHSETPDELYISAGVTGRSLESARSRVPDVPSTETAATSERLRFVPARRIDNWSRQFSSECHQMLGFWAGRPSRRSGAGRETRAAATSRRWSSMTAARTPDVPKSNPR